MRNPGTTTQRRNRSRQQPTKNTNPARIQAPHRKRQRNHPRPKQRNVRLKRSVNHARMHHDDDQHPRHNSPTTTPKPKRRKTDAFKPQKDNGNRQRNLTADRRLAQIQRPRQQRNMKPKECHPSDAHRIFANRINNPSNHKSAQHLQHPLSRVACDTFQIPSATQSKTAPTASATSPGMSTQKPCNKEMKGCIPQ